MSAVLDVLAGGGCAFLGVLLGRRMGRREVPQPPKVEKPSLICGCKHELAYHDLKSGACNATVKQPSKYDYYGNVAAYAHVQCTCQQYTGARPLETYWTPQIYQGDTDAGSL